MRIAIFSVWAALLIFPLRADDPAVAASATVTVTQRAPIEILSPTGDVTGVTESKVGARLSLVSSNGTKLTLQDAQGARFRMSASATDYTPPAPAPVQPASPAVAAAPAATPADAATPTPPKPHAPADASGMPPIPSTSSGPDSAGPTPSPGAAAPAGSSGSSEPSGSVFTTTMDDRPKDNVVAVWPQGGMADRPLLIAAHGNGGSGPGEIQGWLALAKEHKFTIVCPTFKSSVNSMYLSGDEDYFRHILRWITDNLQYDKSNVYMTGFSGGGAATWYLATQRPDFFHGLFLQSGNFWGPLEGLDLGRWRDKPIEVIWGTQDLADIPVQGQKALDALQEAHCKDVIHKVIPNAGHQEHQDLVTAWMEQIMAAPAASN